MISHAPEQPAWYIHTSGTGILTFEDSRAKTCGILREKEYDDWDGIHELINLPDDAFHRNVDKIVLKAGLELPDNIKTAIVCPCAVYGPGRGPGNIRSTQAYTLATTILKRGRGIRVGDGKNIWHQVHIQDLSTLYLTLGEAAVLGGGRATWGRQGYYFAENGSFAWGDIQRSITLAAYEKKFIPTSQVDVLDYEQTARVDLKGPYRWGSAVDSVCRPGFLVVPGRGCLSIFDISRQHTRKWRFFSATCLLDRG